MLTKQSVTPFLLHWQKTLYLNILHVDRALSISTLVHCQHIKCWVRVLWQHINCRAIGNRVLATCKILSYNVLNIWKMELQSSYVLSKYLLCQYAKISVTECSVQCFIFKLQSTLWSWWSLWYWWFDWVKWLSLSHDHD